MNPAGCHNENNPLGFRECQQGYIMEDKGCIEGTCRCDDSTGVPKIRCKHTFVCRRD